MSIILITGASSGIGFELVRQYVAKGHKVVALARRYERLEELKDSLIKFPGKVFSYECDVTKEEIVKNIINDVYKTIGEIDIVIANAGISSRSAGESDFLETYKKIYAVNVFGALNVFNAVIPAMVNRKKGHLVGISSLAGYRGLPEAGAYSSSKAALTTLMESLRLDLKKHHLVVSVISPGFIKTPLTDKNLYKMPLIMSVDKAVKKIIKAIDKKKAIYAFPWSMKVMVQINRILPVWLMDYIFAGKKNLKKQ